MSIEQTPIKNHRAYNKADIARELNCSRVWISRVMRGKVKHPKTLQRIKHYLHNLNQAA